MDLLRTKGECLIDLPLAFAESEKCQKTLRLLKKALAEIPYDSIGSGEDKGIQQEIYQKEVDLQYCLNFPFTKEYERLFSAEAPGVVLRDLRQPMWDVVEQCMKDGTLLDLRSGALDTSLAEKGIQLQPRKPFSFPPETTGEKPRPGAKILPESRDIAEDHPTTASKDATMEEEEIRGNIAQYQPPSPLTTNETPKFERLPLHEAPHKAVPSSRSAPEPRSYEDSESDGGVVLNLTTNDHESGEISEHSLLADGSSDGEDHSGNDHQGYPIDIRGGTDSGPDDAMLEYSNADQAMNFDGPGPQLETRSVQTYQPSTLAELSERDLREQVKYFYITHDPKTIDFKATPIRCLVCTHPGHMAARCPQLTCAHCGKYNDHSPPFCPATQKCPKCREPGHTQSHCKSKLKVPNSELDMRPLLQRRPHRRRLRAPLAHLWTPRRSQHERYSSQTHLLLRMRQTLAPGQRLPNATARKANGHKYMVQQPSIIDPTLQKPALDPLERRTEHQRQSPAAAAIHIPLLPLLGRTHLLRPPQGPAPCKDGPDPHRGSQTRNPGSVELDPAFVAVYPVPGVYQLQSQRSQSRVPSPGGQRL